MPYLSYFQGPPIRHSTIGNIITTDNIHPPKVYANLYQNVCVTSCNDDNRQFYKWK